MADTVAPRVGAWIETTFAQKYPPLTLSHPAWVRGLKQAWREDTGAGLMSHPAWVRGLKRMYRGSNGEKARSQPAYGIHFCCNDVLQFVFFKNAQGCFTKETTICSYQPDF